MKQYTFELYADHETWLNSLAFFEDDLKILRERLREVSLKNTEVEVKQNVEKFQNQFKIQHDEIDYLKHQINAEEKILVKEIQKNTTASEHRKLGDNAELRDRAVCFGKLYEEMKVDFYEFAGKYL